MVDKNDILLREVDEELRRDQMAKLWEKYAVHAGVAAALVVVAVAGFKFWEARRIAAEQSTGARFEDAQRAVSDGKSADALKNFADIAGTAPGGYAALASLQVAALDAKEGRSEKALAAYEALGKNSSVDPLIRDFARLQAAAMRLSAADFTEIQNRLNDVAAAENPWHANARELIALAALRAGKTTDARSMFEQLLSDRRTPTSVSERARIAMARIVEAEQANAASSPAATGKEAQGTGTAAGAPSK